LVQASNKEKVLLACLFKNINLIMGYSDGKEALFRYNKREEWVELTDWNGTAAVTKGVHTTR
jgi:membrane-anchored protein YejM (alkaline phosphatase superfamily)